MDKVLKVIKGVITGFLVLVLVMVVFQKITNSKLAIGNFYIFQIVSESMMPEYKVGDVIVVKKVPANELKVGDDVSYLASASYMKGLRITHKIKDIRKENGSYYFTTKGDANNIEDPEIKYENIYGKVIYHTILFSFVGRLMTNIIIYYLLFVVVGVSFSYDIITSFFMKKDDD